MEQLGTDLAGAVSRSAAKKKTAGKMWDFNVEQKDTEADVLNVDQERIEHEDENNAENNAEYNTKFGDKISEVYYSQLRHAICRLALAAI
jgi:hypothetical protein